MIRIFIVTAFRNIFRNPLLGTIKITGLTIGTLCFVMTLLFWTHEHSYDNSPNADRLYRYVHRVNLPERMEEYAVTGAPTGPAILERFPEVEAYCRLLVQPMTLRSAKQETVFNEERFLYADSTFTQFFPFPLAKSVSDMPLRNPYSVIISPAAAERYFGNEDPIGKTLLTTNRTEFVVTGVFGSALTTTHIGSVDFVASLESLVLMGRDPVWANRIQPSTMLESKGYNIFYTYFLLQPDTDPAAVVAKFPAFIEEFRGQGRSERLKPSLQLMKDIHLHSELIYELDRNGNERTADTFLLIGLLILVISNVNFINISTSEFIKRSKSIGMQKVLGTTRASLIVSFLTETLVLCMLSSLLAVGLLYTLLPFVNELVIRELVIDSVTILVVMPSVALASALLSGLYPAIYITRVRPAEVIRSRFSMGKSISYTRNALVLLQLTISFALVSGAILIYSQLSFLLSKDLGYDTSRLLQVNSNGASPGSLLAFKKEIARTPEVMGVGGSATAFGLAGQGFQITLPESGDVERRYAVMANYVDSEYLNTLNIPLVEGRFFDETIVTDSTEGVVINETAAELLFKGDALGKRIQLPSTSVNGLTYNRTVLGVVKDFHFESLHNTILPLMLIHTQASPTNILVRYRSENAAELVTAIEREWKRLFPQLAFQYTSIEDAAEAVYREEHSLRNLITIFSSIAMGIAAIGLFGTGLFLIEQKTKEFGIRKVLGADNRALHLLFSRPLLILLGTAFAISTPVSYYLGKEWLLSFPYRTSISVGVFVLSFLLIFGVVLLTLVYHFRKMSRLNPATVLKE